MALIDILGAAGAGYQNYQKGADQELARQQQQLRDQEEQSQIRARMADAPLQQEAARLKTQGQIEQARADAEIAPVRRDTERRAAQAENKLIDGKVKLAEAQQDQALSKTVFDTITQAANGAKTVDQAQTDVMAIAGKQLASGNYNGLNTILQHAISAPIFPALNGMGKPVKTELGQPPEGEMDVSGLPAQPNSLKVTFEDGSVKWINTAGMSEAYRRKLAADHKPMISKAGDTARDPITGKVLWQNDPKPSAGWMYNKEGDLEFVGGGGGRAGAGGAGAGGAAGKAVDPYKLATDAFQDIATKSESKLPAEVFARGQRIAQQVFSEGGGKVPASVAAEVALAVATDPTKAEPSVNLATGKIDSVYRSQDNGEFVISRGIASANNPANLPPEQLKKAVTSFLGATKPELRTQLTEAAFNPEARAKLEQAMFAEYDQAVEKRAQENPKEADTIRRQAEATKAASKASLDEKLGLINRYGDKPKPAAAQRQGGFNLQFGGLSRPTTPTDPNSPAGRSQALQQAARQRSEAKEAERTEATSKLSSQFQADKKTMPPLELARKYDELRRQLPSNDAAELQQIERTIR